MKNGKTTGHDGWRRMNNPKKFLNTPWSRGAVTKSWKVDSNSITLLSTVTKLYESMLNKNLTKIMEQHSSINLSHQDNIKKEESEEKYSRNLFRSGEGVKQSAL